MWKGCVPEVQSEIMTRVNALTSGEELRTFLLRGFVNTALFRRVSVLIDKRVELCVKHTRANGVAILYNGVTKYVHKASYDNSPPSQ